MHLGLSFLPLCAQFRLTYCTHCHLTCRRYTCGFHTGVLVWFTLPDSPPLTFVPTSLICSSYLLFWFIPARFPPPLFLPACCAHAHRFGFTPTVGSVAVSSLFHYVILPAFPVLPLHYLGHPAHLEHTARHHQFPTFLFTFFLPPFSCSATAGPTALFALLFLFALPALPHLVSCTPTFYFITGAPATFSYPAYHHCYRGSALQFLTFCAVPMGAFLCCLHFL